MKHSKLTIGSIFSALCILIPILGYGAGRMLHGCSEGADDTNTEMSRKTGFPEIAYPSPNYDPDKKNEVQGVVLHHTAEATIERSLELLTIERRPRISTHVVIDFDGTRYILLPPTAVGWHAGYSLHAGRENCNEWMLGIEFQGDTNEEPLTQDQIDSAIEWLLPLIADYHIPLDNIVSHQMIRTAYKEKHPASRALDKPDITPQEYDRFMQQLRSALKKLTESTP